MTRIRKHEIRSLLRHQKGKSGHFQRKQLDVSGGRYSHIQDGFTDTDGKQYYMDKAGIVQTGWTDIGK